MIRRTHSGTAGIDDVSTIGAMRSTYTGSKIGGGVLITPQRRDYTYGLSRAALRPIVPVGQ